MKKSNSLEKTLATIQKNQDQRRELSVALANIIDFAVPVEGNENHVVPSYLIKDAKKCYNKIWRKP